MAKEFFKDLPNTTTPLTATRLNGLLDGDEALGNLVVDSIKTKNLFDKNTLVQGDISNGYPNIRLSSRQALWLETGTYTFSTNMTSSYNYNLIVENAGVPPLASQPTFIYTSGWITASSTTFTISTAGWFLIYLRRSDNGNFTATDISTLTNYNYQLENGSSATTITAYQNLTGDFWYTKSTYTSNGAEIRFEKYGRLVIVTFEGTTNANLTLNVDYSTTISSIYTPAYPVRNSVLFNEFGVIAYIYLDGTTIQYRVKTTVNSPSYPRFSFAYIARN